MTNEAGTTQVERVLSWLLTLAAVSIAAILAHREFLGGASRQGPPQLKPTLVPQWETLLTAGNEIGKPDAPIKLIEFADFECPACRQFHGALSSVLQRYGPERVSLVFIHFPLKQHRFAQLAARASECAKAQGGFGRLHDVLFDKQDSLGLKPWSSYAVDAGITDTLKFMACQRDTARVDRIVAGLEAGKKLSVMGTPTVLINGWRLARPPSEAEFITMIDRVLAGKAPVS